VLVELREQSTPRGVRESGKSVVEGAIRILNHMVKYTVRAPVVNSIR
jgi:hypothetical protein